MDEDGNETFVTGGALDRVQKASGTCDLKYIIITSLRIRKDRVAMLDLEGLRETIVEFYL